MQWKAVSYFILVIFLCGLSITAFAGLTCNSQLSQQTYSSKKYLELRESLRGLIAERMIYERNYIISVVASLKDQNTVVARLQKNQNAICDLLQPYYGSDSSAKLLKLFHNDITMLGDSIKAARSGNKIKTNKIQAKWDVNASEIAFLLGTMNSYWVEKTVVNALNKHNYWTFNEALSRIKKDWESDIGYSDSERIQMLNFADTLVAGIAKQFPEKFAANSDFEGNQKSVTIDESGLGAAL